MPKVANTQENIKKCACTECPSYNDCSRDKGVKLFCSDEVGKSICALAMNGCLCGPCAVHEENDLRAGYYCIHGSADEVDKK